MADIVLSTLNAKYIHTAFGLRYLYANMGALQPQTVIKEFTIANRPIDIAEALLAEKPKIIGLGVYIWNIQETEQLVAMLKALAPEVMIVLGGPEVSYEYVDQAIVRMADYVVCGQGEISFPQLCEQLLNRQKPLNKVIAGIASPLDQLVLPYDHYTEEDVANRFIYVEASRGCPFKCEFCLSALDKTAKPFELERFLQAMDQLYQRGVRHFKFVDRTFNLKIKTTIQILTFFLERMSEDLFLHFELIPDHLPDDLKAVIQRFPEGSLQFEIGIQTFDPAVQALISRKQHNEKSKANLRWLREETHAHLHTDLIFGLPGEDLASFEHSFNELVALQPHEIQVGILKRLKGSPIIRHTDEYKLVFNPNPPYNILSTDRVDFATMQQMNRFARYWDMIGNSGRFTHTLPELLADQPFQRFWVFTQWLFDTTGQTHKIALKRLYDLVYQALLALFDTEQEALRALIKQDVDASGMKGGVPECIRHLIPNAQSRPATLTQKQSQSLNQRQKRHQI